MGESSSFGVPISHRAREFGVPCREALSRRPAGGPAPLSRVGAPPSRKALSMRPVRFVALSEDGQALVLADEVGRLLTLPIDDRVSTHDAHRPRRRPGTRFSQDEPPSLAPRDIQARIRSGESAEDVARIAGRAGRPGAPLRRPGAAGAGDARPARPADPAQDLRQGRLAGRGGRRPAEPARRRHGEDLLGRLPPRRRHLAGRGHLAVGQGQRDRGVGARQGPAARRAAGRHGPLPVRHARPARTRTAATRSRRRAPTGAATSRCSPGASRPAPGPRPDPGRSRRAAGLARASTGDTGRPAASTRMAEAPAASVASAAATR